MRRPDPLTAPLLILCCFVLMSVGFFSGLYIGMTKIHFTSGVMTTQEPE